LGFADFRPPFWAGTKVPSTKHSSHRICSRSWSWARKARHSFSRVPSRVQRGTRSWTVLLGPYRRGTSRHCAPVHKIHRMPSNQRRSSAAGRPPGDSSHVSVIALGFSSTVPLIVCAMSFLYLYLSEKLGYEES